MKTDCTETLLTVTEVALRLRVEPSWVYSHADDLGVYRLGKYLRFSWERVLDRLKKADLVWGHNPTIPNTVNEILSVKRPWNR